MKPEAARDQDHSHAERNQEIPEVAARLLDVSDKPLAEAGKAIRARDPRFLVTVARGSSDHAASFMKYAIELTAGIPVASIGPSVTSIYGARLRLAGSACLAISQSGKSPDIVAMAEAARQGGSLTVALTNTAGFAARPRLRPRDHIVAGVEKSVAATKTFVNSAVAGLALLAHWHRRQCAARRPRRTPSPFADSHRMRLDGPCRRACGGRFALHPRARTLLRHCQ